MGNIYIIDMRSLSRYLLLMSCIWNNGTYTCIQNQERLEGFLIWAITTAVQSVSSRRLKSNESHIFSKSHENSLVSKLLCWLTASVIIGKLYQKSDDMDSGFAETQHLDTLQSLLVHVENTSGQRHDTKIGIEKLLASTIFYLQLLLGMNHEVLPSVVSALCLLIFGASSFAGILFLYFTKCNYGDKSGLARYLLRYLYGHSCFWPDIYTFYFILQWEELIYWKVTLL